MIQRGPEKTNLTLLWQHWSVRARQKPLALSLAYTGIIIYASLYSTSTWRDNGVSPFSFLEATWPRYWTWQDAWFNVLAYAPLGFLLTLSPAHRLLPWARVLLPVCIGFLLSMLMESLQTYIPGRVSSSLDLLLNTAGTLLGSAVALFCGPKLLQIAGQLRRQLGVQRLSAEAGLLLLWLWLFAQISPETLFFGLGDLRSVLNLPQALPFSPDIYHRLETTITALQTLVLAFLIRAVVQRLGLNWSEMALTLMIVLAIGIMVRVVASWTLLGPIQPTFNGLRWAALTPGGLQGLLLGLLLALPALTIPGRWQMPVAAMLLMASTVLVNLMPTNPYSVTALNVWRQGHFLNFNGLTRLIAAIWPYLTLLFLVWTDRRIHSAPTAQTPL